MRNEFDEFVPGPVIDMSLKASVQPVELEDVLDPNDAGRLSDRRRVYAMNDADGTPSLAAAFDDREPDRVTYNGEEYIVESAKPWPHYVEAVLLRET